MPSNKIADEKIRCRPRPIFNTLNCNNHESETVCNKEIPFIQSNTLVRYSQAIRKLIIGHGDSFRTCAVSRELNYFVSDPGFFVNCSKW